MISPLRFKIPTERGALLSPDRKYRYLLWRFWEEQKSAIGFVGLNPSTADENVDDATIRRCVGFGKRWGYSGIIMANIWAFRATDPKNLKKHSEQEARGPENADWLRWMARNVQEVVLAWGTHGVWEDGSLWAIDALMPAMIEKSKEFSCFGQTKSGEPKHPLRLENSTLLREFPIEQFLADKDIWTSKS